MRLDFLSFITKLINTSLSYFWTWEKDVVPLRVTKEVPKRLHTLVPKRLHTLAERRRIAAAHAIDANRVTWIVAAGLFAWMQLSHSFCMLLPPSTCVGAWCVHSAHCLCVWVLVRTLAEMPCACAGVSLWWHEQHHLVVINTFLECCDQNIW